MAQILGLGNPLLDISVEVENLELLEKYGLKMGNAILAGPEHQALYAEVVSKFGSSVQYIAGGATQNSIRVAQWVSGESSGYTGYVGAIGSDEFGTTLTKSAQSEGVTTLYQVSSEKPTGTCAVLVYQQERSLVANLALFHRVCSVVGGPRRIRDTPGVAPRHGCSQGSDRQREGHLLRWIPIDAPRRRCISRKVRQDFI